MPGIPPIPQFPSPAGGGTAPAAPMRREQGGDEARQKVLMGLALVLMSKAHSIAPLSGDAPEIAGVLQKFGKRFAPPEPSLGKSELKFLETQLTPQGPSAGPQPGGAAPGMPPVPPMPPAMPQAA